MIDWLVDTLWATAALIGLVLVLRRPVARHFGAELAYALWLLPLARLALPPIVLPARFAPAATLPAEVPAGLSRATGADVPGLIVSAEPGFALSWSTLLAAVWLGGAALFLASRWIDYRAMRARLLCGAVQVDCREGVRIVETAAVTAPVAFGVRDKVIALPPRFLITGRIADRGLAIEHEFAHHRRRDLLANLAAQPLLALHWFNPLAWLAWEAMRRDQEAACDARVMAGRDPATRAAYGRVIASFAAGNGFAPQLALAAPMAAFGGKSIIHRLRSLNMPEITSPRRRVGRWALASVGALALPLTASIGYAAQNAPAPPAAPTAPSAPEAPVTPKRVEKRVIVDHLGDAPGEAKHVREIERDGKTIKIVTANPLSDAEFEARLVDMEKSLPEMRDASEAPLPPGAKREVRKVIVMSDRAGHGAGHAGAQPARFAAVRECAGDAIADISSEQGDDADKRLVRFKLCGKPGEGRAEALAGIRKARAHVAENDDMDPGMRADVLKKFDQRIAELETSAG